MQTFAKKNELALSKLAQLLDIPLKTGWKTRLSEWFDIDLSLLSNWIKRGIPKYRIKEVQKKGYPIEQWYNVPEPYREPEENIGTPQNYGRESRPQEYTEPTNVKWVPRILVGPPHPDQEYIDAVKEILDSGEKGTINALKSNITQFQEQVRDKKRMRDLENQVKLLTKQLSDEKNGGDSPKDDPSDNADSTNGAANE